MMPAYKANGSVQDNTRQGLCIDIESAHGVCLLPTCEEAWVRPEGPYKPLLK